MKPRRLAKACVLFIAAVLLASLAVPLYRHLTLPRYQGKTAAEWFRFRRDARSLDDYKTAREAFLQMGAPAAPYLVRELAATAGEPLESAFLSRIVYHRSGRPRQFPFFLRRLIPDPFDRFDRYSSASDLLIQLGPLAIGEEKKLVKLLVKDSSRSNWRILDIIASFGHSGSNCIPAVAALLTPGAATNDSTLNIVRTFAAITPPGTPEVRFLEDAIKAKLYPAGKTIPYLSTLNGNIEPLVPLLRAEIHSPDRTIRLDAIRAVQSLGKLKPLLLEDCLAELHDEDPRYRAEFLQAVRAMGPEAAHGVNQIVQYLSDDYYYVRAEAANALAAIGLQAGAALPLLEKLKRDAHPDVVQAAARAIASIGPLEER